MSEAAGWPAPRELLPHGPEAVFVQEVLERSDDAVACRVVPGTADARHVRAGVVPAALAVEYLAQTIGVLAELDAEPGQRGAPGFVIAIRELELLVDGFAVGETLVARVICDGGDDRLAQFRGVLTRGDDVLARAVLAVFRPAPDEAPA